MSNVIKDIKDNGYKRALETPKLLCEFLKDFVDLEIVKDIKPEELTDYTERFLPLFIDHKDSDVIKVVKTKQILFLVMIEHQSKNHFLMSFRMLQYIVLIWEEWIKLTEEEKPGSTTIKDFRLPPILPIVYYTGESKWTAETNIFDKVSQNDIFQKYIPSFSYELIKLKDYNIDTLLEFNDLISFIMLLDKIKNIEQLDDVIRQMREKRKKPFDFEIEESLVELLDTIVYLFLKRTLASDDEIEEIRNFVKERKVTCMFEELEESTKRWKEELIEKGVEKGKEENSIEIVKNMLEKYLTIEQIVEYTGLSVERVKEIEEELFVK